MDEPLSFESEVAKNIEQIGLDTDLQACTRIWLRAALEYNYSHNFKWLGRPIIQAPQDIVAMQELIWQTKPDLIIETGIAHGGSIIFSASMLALLDVADALDNGTVYDAQNSKRKVVGIDIDIRAHNRMAIEAHPLSGLVHMVEGSSVERAVIDEVARYAEDYERIMVCLDSNHTHEHVLGELDAYAPLVSISSYCVVFDTGIEDLPERYSADRPWGKGNNPKTAVYEYLKTHPEFEIDKSIQHKLLITAAPDGYLRRVR